MTVVEALIRKRQGILPFDATWMDLVGTVLSGVRQTEKDKWNLKKKKLTPTHRYRERFGGCQR